MLSRRNIRIKVMQMLYAQSRDKNVTFDHSLKNYRLSVQSSFDLYLYTLLLLMKVAGYAAQDSERKKSKFRPSDDDLIFRPNLAENDLVSGILKNAKLLRIAKKKFDLDAVIDPDTIRRIYTEFAKLEIYKEYSSNKEEISGEEHQTMVLELFKFCIKNPDFIEVLEDYYPAWQDDESLIVGAIKKTLKSLPADEDFFEEYRPTNDTVVDFGEILLKSSFDKEEELFNIIEPTLKNWDAERVAVLDMILLKMALCELMLFPTIPTKVTLNEYVEISKIYSTDKSKDFINGILDRLMKKLQTEGKILKEGRGLLD